MGSGASASVNGLSRVGIPTNYEWDLFLKSKGLEDGARRSIEIARSDRDVDVCVKVYLQGPGTRVTLLV